MKECIRFYKDGAIIRLKNRRISFIESQKGDGIFIQFNTAPPKEELNLLAYSFKQDKGKVNRLKFGITHESMQQLIYAYAKFMNNKLSEKPNP